MSKFNVLKNGSKPSADNLKQLYEELIQMHNTNYIEKYEDQCKEVINLIIEFLIYGDKHDSAIFDSFCEYNFMNQFIILACLNNRNISLQIIKSFSLLILNTSNTTTLYYIFSNNFINQLITNDFEKYDDDFISYYINFLKSLSLKMDTTTIQFFLRKQFNSFPLLQSAIKMYNHSDAMIKNTVRNIILTILKIRYEPVIEIFSSLPLILYFPFLSCRLRDLIKNINDELINDNPVGVKNIHDDIIDDILYLQDIFSLNLNKINYILINSLFYYTILPLLSGSLVSMTTPKITINTSLFIITSLLYYIKDECFLNMFIYVLFSPSISIELNKLINEYPKNIKNYHFDWSTQKKATISSFNNYIMNNFSEPFINSILHHTNTYYPEISAIIRKYSKSDETNQDKIYNSLYDEILNRFSNSELDIMMTFHKNVTKATGVCVGIVNQKINSIVQLIEISLNNKGIKNECRENILIYLKSKDDTLILLVNLLIHVIQIKNIPKEIMSLINMSKADDLTNESITNKILYELFGNNSSLDTTISVDKISLNVDTSINYEKEDELNLFNEFTRIDNSYVSQIKIQAQTEYDIELIDNLLNLMMIEQPFRTITNRLLLNNLSILLIKKNNLNIIQNSHLDKINKIYSFYLNNIKQILNNNKFIRENGYELFETEWKNYNSTIDSILEELLNAPYLLFPFNLDDTIQDYPKLLRIQSTGVDYFSGNLLVFMIIHDMRCIIYKDKNYIHNNFPLVMGGCELQIGMIYDSSELSLQLYQCKYKNKSLNSYISVLLTIYQNYIHFVQHDTDKQNYVNVKYKYALRHIETQVDKSDLKILNLIVKDHSGYCDISIIFGDVSIASSVFKILEESKKAFRNTEYLLLDSYFEDLINKSKL